jgi:hypothetical protein
MLNAAFKIYLVYYEQSWNRGLHKTNEYYYHYKSENEYWWHRGEINALRICIVD